ncbi:MAG: hypothetical protein GOV01_00150 [Candidatus Altiarchaeota archaeon]|nr:hypothetical protein [Candidatus Altiarchaeota archaeon]
MAKVMNVVFGVGIAIMIFIVALLGIEVFYPRPDIADFGCNDIRAPKLTPCTENMTVGECRDLEFQQMIDQENSQESKDCWDLYDSARDDYNRDFFLITAVLGFIAIIGSMYMFSMINIAAGTTSSGLALIVFGFMVGWQSTNDSIKFIVSIIITMVVVKFAIIVNKWYDVKNKGQSTPKRIKKK